MNRHDPSLHIRVIALLTPLHTVQSPCTMLNPAAEAVQYHIVRMHILAQHHPFAIVLPETNPFQS
jgi:hypothetical protein